MNVRWLSGLVLLASLALLAGGAQQAAGLEDGTRLIAASSARAPVGDQALRTCVDRWNQANMVGWGPALVRISVRTLGTDQLAQVGLRHPSLRRCVVLFAFEVRRGARKGCPGAEVVPGKPGYCVDRSGTFFCVINVYGAYACPPRHEPDRTLPLKKQDGATDTRGVLRLVVPLRGTQAARPLTWQHYPHTDGWIEPWERFHRLRTGLTFTGTFRGGGSCGVGSEQSVAKSAIRCLWRNSNIVDPCFPPQRRWNHLGVLVACSTAPGARAFTRFEITRRS